MSTAPGPYVEPTWRLATLTLETGPIPLANVRRSTIGGDVPVITSPRAVHAQPFLGESKGQGASASPYQIKSANSSENTLIDSSPKTPDTEPEDISMEGVEQAHAAPQQTESPIDVIADAMDPEAMPLLTPERPPTPPQRPPPVPPRPIGPINKPEAERTDKDSISRAAAEAAAQQQDVNEAMGNVLFKMECAIKSFERDGKQTDHIKE